MIQTIVPSNGYNPRRDFERVARVFEQAAATRDRVMPPWKPEPGYGQFADERRLTEE